MKTFSIVLIYLNLSLCSQILDDFSSTKLDTWFGDTNLFSVENDMLRSLGPNLPNQTLFISKSNTLRNETSWQLHLELKFNPTTSNFVRVYLAANRDSLTKPLNGYFVQLGETNSDTLDFYLQRGNTITKIFTGKTAFANTVNCNIKIATDKNGLWSFWIDPGSTGNYSLEGSIVENSITTSQFFGIYCQYATASRYNQFFFDDIEVKKTVKDTLPPYLQNVLMVNDSILNIRFSEKVRNPIININNISIDQFQYCNIDSTILCLNSNASFLKGKENKITIQSIEDLLGNININLNSTFIYPRNPLKNELVFTELMIDESPSQGLPEKEYIEIYNLSNDYLTSSHCSIFDGTKNYVFPQAILNPKTYYLLCATSSVNDFGSIQNKLSLSSFPSLTNSGKILQIFYDSTLVNTVAYTDKWCSDPHKCEGGWSLEIQDLDNFCMGSANWTMSKAATGGTPSAVNSVNTELVDSTPPRLINIDVKSTSLINLKFSENLNSSSDFTKNIFISGVNILNIDSKLIAEGILILQINSLDTNKTYEISIINLQDCEGNINPKQDTSIFICPKLQTGDLLINEVLFDAVSNGAEYIEVYNSSDHTINLNQVRFAKAPNNYKSVTEQDLFLLPHSYFVLTDNKSFVESHYNDVLKDHVLELKSWLSLSDDSGSIYIQNLDSTIIDKFHYDKNFHNPLVNNPDGVSLEKTNPKAFSNNPVHWQSASATSGFGTPTLENSQMLKTKSKSATLSTKVISPNGDGRDDYCLINLENRKQAEFVNIRIIDSEGKIIKTLAKNLSISAAGAQFTWDGTLENNSKAPIGAYLLHIETYAYDSEASFEIHNIAVFE